LPEIKGNEKKNKAKKPKTTFELFFFKRIPCSSRILRGDLAQRHITVIPATQEA
jgi:hypothetical protein